MLYTAAIIFVGIGTVLLFTSFFVLLFNLLVQVLKDKEIDIEPTMERFIIAGVLIGTIFFVFGGTLLGTDTYLKPFNH